MFFMDDHVILPDSSTKDIAGLFSWSTLSTCRKKIDSHRIEISHDEFAIEWACIMCGKTYMINNVFGIHMIFFYIYSFPRQLLARS